MLLDELRAYLDETVPAFRATWGPDPLSWEARCAWQRILAEGKWAAPAWAVENGGRGVGVTDQLAIETLMAEYGMPALPGMLGLKNVGPTIAVWGTSAQKEHLARILSAEEIWCQGFSEPGAGSDLAGLQTKAVEDGDDYVVNGQKIWTSNGMYATHMELLVRTDPDAPKHKGISALCVDMTSPGIEVRPIKQINGHAEFAEVFFTDVRVPKADLLGPANRGWDVTRTTLGNERGGVVIFAARLEQQIRDLIAERAAAREAGVVLDPVENDRFVEHFIQARVIAMLGELMMTRLVAGEAPGAEQSVIKMLWSEELQRLAETRFEYGGLDSVLGDPLAQEYLSSRSATIAAGTSQVVRNILAERVLGLPRD